MAAFPGGGLVDAGQPPAVASRRTWLRLAGLALLILVVAAELLGRWLGLHHPVLFERTEYGYRVKPNQDILRFGNRVFFNDLGLRSESTPASPSPGTIRVLCIGDSVTYGGATTDQARTYPYLLQEQLKPQPVEVLNASAPGWAVPNELGWLKANGTLGSSFVVLTISTHDLFQQLAPSSIVGRHPSFPDHEPTLALEGVASRYLLPRVVPWITTLDPGVSRDGGWSDRGARLVLEDIEAFVRLVRAAGARPVLLLSTEAIDPTEDGLAAVARRQLYEALSKLDVPILTIDAAIAREGRAALYRDTVHPNEHGNLVFAQAVAAYLQPYLSAGNPGDR